MNRHPDAPRPLARSTRVALAASALALLGLYGLAGWLEPDPRGYGTHERLGLPPCGFAAATGRRCPTCGMTTAFAWFARGRPVRAWSANPAGLGLAASGLGLVPWLLAAAARGRAWGSRTLERPLTLFVLAGAAVSLLAWILRLDPWRAL